MGKPTGFMDYERQSSEGEQPLERIKHFNEFHAPLGKKERKEQAARCMECGVPFCQSGTMITGMLAGCPLNNLIPEWNDLLYWDNIPLAIQRLKKTNNFPEFTGRVCPAPCESACTCGLNCDPVSIKENELEIVEQAYKTGVLQPKSPKVRTGKKVAVIGSGPSGLAAADQLNHRGHSVTVFEKSDRVGGLLMYGIPNMKLEKTIVERRVSLMEKEGVVFRTGCDVGASISAQWILEEFDAVVLACGTALSRDIKVPGREGKGIHFAVDYLTAATKGLLDHKKPAAEFYAEGKDVLVIGGGDTGNDCVGTAVRQGAKSVTQLEMMPKQPETRDASSQWPIWPRLYKVDYGQEEAAAVFGCDPRVFKTTVTRFFTDANGNVNGAELVSLEAQTDPNTGRTNMVPVEGSAKIIDTQLVLIAAGFIGANPKTAEAFGATMDNRGNVDTKGAFQTANSKVFATGDMRRGQSLVVWAIREGRDAAAAVDKFLMGYTNKV